MWSFLGLIVDSNVNVKVGYCETVILIHKMAFFVAVWKYLSPGAWWEGPQWLLTFIWTKQGNRPRRFKEKRQNKKKEGSICAIGSWEEEITMKKNLYLKGFTISFLDNDLSPRYNMII